MWPLRRVVAVASALLGALALGGPSALGEPPAIAELQWIHVDADAIAALTMQPVECLVDPADPDRARLARLGRVAFRSPVLLGGLAARVGMSCDSCHRNGHDNPVFHFTGVSGVPGTADVTGSVFSTRREDGLSNPVSIPSLIDVASKSSFGSIRPTADLRTFLLAAVVDEFQGDRPSPSVVEGMLEYLAGLRSAGCPTPGQTAVRFASDAHDVLETFDVVVEALEEGDRLAGEFALRALRATLEGIYRRFPASVSAREDLIVRSRALSHLRPKIRASSLSETIALLIAERPRLEAVLQELETKADDSFYEPSVLRQALK